MSIRMGGFRLPRRVASAGTLVLLLLIVACGQPSSIPVPPAHDPKQDEAQIRAAAARIWAGVAGDDAAAALAEYSEDAILLGTAMATVRGKSAITEQLTGRQLGVGEATFYIWKKKYAHLGVTELRKLRSLEDEKTRLKKVVADLSLDRHVLTEALREDGRIRPRTLEADFFGICCRQRRSKHL